MTSITSDYDTCLMAGMNRVALLPFIIRIALVTKLLLTMVLLQQQTTTIPVVISERLLSQTLPKMVMTGLVALRVMALTQGCVHLRYFNYSSYVGPAYASTPTYCH